MPEVAKIERHQHLPKLVYKMQRQRKHMNDAAKRKEASIAAHSRPMTDEELRKKLNKDKAVVTELE